jgi:hypothetical protein
VQEHDAASTSKSARVESDGARASIAFSKLSAGPFSGELVLRFYAGSPFIHVEAAMGLEENLVAYIYDFTLDGDWKSVSWKDNVTEQWTRVVPEGAPEAGGVRNRAIFGESRRGMRRRLPPPHAFFFPRDHTVNFKFAQVGKNRFGLRQDPRAVPGHQGAYIPVGRRAAGRRSAWPAFVWLGDGTPEAALEQAEEVHARRRVQAGGRALHVHQPLARAARDERAGRQGRRGRRRRRSSRRMNVNIVHLAEFHGDGNPNDPGPKRLPQMKKMFDGVPRLFGREALFIPGEEANAPSSTCRRPKGNPRRPLALPLPEARLSHARRG